MADTALTCMCQGKHPGIYASCPFSTIGLQDVHIHLDLRLRQELEHDGLLHGIPGQC